MLSPAYPRSYIHGGALGDSKIKNARDALAEFERSAVGSTEYKCRTFLT